MAREGAEWRSARKSEFRIQNSRTPFRFQISDF